ncbi:MAG: asparaginase [Pseudomonadota bacterium]
MTDAFGPDGSVTLAEVIRGDFVECVHRGAAVICRPDGEIAEAWGDPARTVLPRSSCKMLQALPLVESGAAEAAGLNSEHLALACASHSGAAIHTERVRRWLADLELDESDLRCGPQAPQDPAAFEALTCGHDSPDQCHNNCSGKHAGFLTLNRHLGGGPEYVEPDHPVQKAVAAAFHEMTGEGDMGHVVDGCSAPNFVTSLTGLARAMARMARPEGLGPRREAAARRLVGAMTDHPELVAGEGRACTGLMRALDGRGAVKTGAEGVFAAILPEAGLGVALKVDDGATRASECAMAAILAKLGAVEADHPEVAKRRNPPQLNRRNLRTGEIRPGAALV